MNSTKAFVCPLSWGLGHATRCIPIVEALLENKVEVILGGNGASGRLLQNRFPKLRFVDAPFHEIKIHRHLPAWLSIIVQLPTLFCDLRKEKRFAQTIIDEYGIDFIISDNRYGLHSSKATTVLVTHQLHIILPLLLMPFEPILTLLVRLLTSHFTQIWVPDFSTNVNLSGKLSHLHQNEKMNVVYIGPLSRFRQTLPKNQKIKGKVVAIISGPEPRRSLIQKTIVKQATAEDVTLTMICGRPTDNHVDKRGNITLYSHLSDENILAELSSAEVVIANAGYSTIMDLWRIKCHAILLPFSGQTEQQYLAKYHNFLGNHLVIMPNNFDLKTEMKKFTEFQFRSLKNTTSADLQEAISHLLDNHEHNKHGNKSE